MLVSSGNLRPEAFRNSNVKDPFPDASMMRSDWKCFHVTVRRSVTNTRGDAGVRFTDDVKDSTSALHFDIRQALHLSAQSQLNQWSRHCVGRPAEFNSRPSILSWDLIQHVKTPIDRHCSSPT